MHIAAQRLRHQFNEALRKGRGWVSRFSYRGQHR